MAQDLEHLMCIYGLVYLNKVQKKGGDLNEHSQSQTGFDSP